jgi:hypothetical protein
LVDVTVWLGAVEAVMVLDGDGGGCVVAVWGDEECEGVGTWLGGLQADKIINIKQVHTTNNFLMCLTRYLEY